MRLCASPGIGATSMLRCELGKEVVLDIMGESSSLKSAELNSNSGEGDISDLLREPVSSSSSAAEVSEGEMMRLLFEGVSGSGNGCRGRVVRKK